MGTIGTFDAFTTARLGIYAAQLGLQVTGNNVANINTEGYTRQRLDQLSFKAGAYDRYRSQMDNHIGTGALVMGINQIRDPYLDVRYRNVSAEVGYSDTMLAGLQKIAAILDEVGLGEDASSNEVGDGVIHAQLQDLATKLREYGENPTSLNDTLVRNSAETLCFLLNDYADKLESLYQETVKDFDDQITQINECLTNIRDLNREIRDCEIYGDNALELRDERNRQIDKLSSFLHIKVIYTEEDIGAGQMVEKLSIYLDDDNPDKLVKTDSSMLIDGVFGAQLSSPEKMLERNPDYEGKKDPALKGFVYLKPDGTGTNDPEEANRVENNIFAVEIGKLLDVKNKEWSKVESTDPKALTQAEVEALGGKVPVNAVYSFAFTPAAGTTWSEGDKFDVAGKTFRVGKDISEEDANDPDKLLAFIASKMNTDPEAGYRVTAENGKLIFTAKQYGEVPPDKLPTVTVTNDPDNKLAFGPAVEETKGVDAVPPQAPAPNPSIDPATGREVLVSYTLKKGTWYETTTYTEHTHVVGLDDNDINGSLQATRELLTEAGEFATKDMVAKIDENAAEKRGIPYYQYSLDLLAKQFADQYNKLNQGYMLNHKGNYVDKDGTELMLAGEAVNRYDGLTAAQKQALIDDGCVLMDENNQPILDDDGNQIPDVERWIEAKGGVKMGGVLFSNRNDNNDPTGITAANISVSQGWSTGSVQLVPKFEVLFDGDVANSTQNINAGHMLNLIEKGLVYDPTQIVPDAVGTKLFEGNFNDMFNNINVTRGKDERFTTITLNNSYARLVETETQREGVSGVDLNDEAMNMMQFSKAMNAAMRLMTVIDDSLDRLINNTAV